jgi:predicted AAA+ superfamily ATPase
MVAQGLSKPTAHESENVQLLPFSPSATNKVNLLHGGFPEVLARPKSRLLWFASYLQTYLERDVRELQTSAI